jgi:hypothetical protein
MHSPALFGISRAWRQHHYHNAFCFRIHVFYADIYSCVWITRELKYYNANTIRIAVDFF